MTYAIAAAGTGGHVFPGLAVGEALVDSGIPADQILFIGGSRLESQVYPEAGFPFLEVEMRGLQRRITATNLKIPALVAGAARKIAGEIRSRQIRVLLGMGGYVSVPAGLAARRAKAILMTHEQNAEAGLANRIMSRWAVRVFGSFPATAKLPKAEWVGNPIRRNLARFDRTSLRPVAHERYGLDPGRPVVGVFGGSLGAAVLNRIAGELATLAGGKGFSVLHLTGSNAFVAINQNASSFPAWKTISFENRMDFFYAACDLIISRAGGAVAELTATGTPSILVPGGFGSGGHQQANAAELAAIGAAIVVNEPDVAQIRAIVERLIVETPGQGEISLPEMKAACSKLARPDAATVIAAAMRAAHG